MKELSATELNKKKFGLIIKKQWSGLKILVLNGKTVDLEDLMI